jgi:hypothetical protein
MKPHLLFVFALAGAQTAWPQSATTTITRDINGRPVDGPVYTTAGTPKDSQRTERSQSVNGRQVPLDQTVDRVLQEDANSKTTERMVRKFSPSGQLISTERVLIEEAKLPGGGSSVRETTSRSDLNGTFQPAERRTVETRIQGSTTTATTVVDKPTLNGSFATVEKRSAVTEGPDTNQRTTESVYALDASGGFKEVARSSKTSMKTGDTTTETTANFAPGMTGQLQVSSQSESVSRKRPDGSDLIETNLYAPTVDGRLQESNTAMRVAVHQTVERRTNPDGSVVETLSVQKPSMSDPTRLGGLQRISETVCKGNCLPDPAKPAAATAKP